MGNTVNFTEGSIGRQMFAFATPLFLSNLLQAVYNIVDMIVVGHAVGSVGLSAISVGGDIQNLLTFLAMGFSDAGQIIIAQHIGAGSLVRLGLPMALKSASVQVTKLFVNSSVNAYGVIASSASGIESKLNMIANLVSNAINVSCSTMIGQNIGAEKYERVPKIMRIAFSITFSFCVIFSFVVVVFPDVLFGLFTAEEGVLEACKSMTFLLVLIFLGGAARTPNNGLIDGSGNYKLNFAVAILDGIVNRIFFAILFGSILGMGWIGYLYGDAVAGFTPFLIGSVYYLSGKWRTREFVIR